MPYVRVISSEKKQIGIMPMRDALGLARRQNLDLVEVSPQADPPVCRIMDFGRYVYAQRVKDKESKKRQHAVAVRQIRFSMKIGEHDYQIKLRKIRELLAGRDRVKVMMTLRGREILHKHRALAMISRLTTELEAEATLEGPPKIEGESRLTILALFLPK